VGADVPEIALVSRGRLAVFENPVRCCWHAADVESGGLICAEATRATTIKRARDLIRKTITPEAVDYVRSRWKSARSVGPLAFFGTFTHYPERTKA
jgi:hypothetical protein